MSQSLCYESKCNLNQLQETTPNPRLYGQKQTDVNISLATARRAAAESRRGPSPLLAPSPRFVWTPMTTSFPPAEVCWSGAEADRR